jgi:hypothetical protein
MKLLAINVNPMYGYANFPDLEGLVDCMEMPEGIYTKTSVGLYYLQREDGFTHFFAHDGDLIPTSDENVFETVNRHGFGGSNYPTKIILGNKEVTVNVRGPWSSGWHMANHFLPKKVYGIALDSIIGYGWGAWHVDIDILSQMLPKGWSFKFQEIEGKSWRDIELVYNGVCKEDMSDGQLKALDEEYKKIKANIKSMKSDN